MDRLCQLKYGWWQKVIPRMQRDHICHVIGGGVAAEGRQWEGTWGEKYSSPTEQF